MRNLTRRPGSGVIRCWLAAFAVTTLCAATFAGCDGSGDSLGQDSATADSTNKNVQETPGNMLISSATENVLLSNGPDAWSPTLAAAYVDGTLHVYGRDEDSVLTDNWTPEFDSDTFTSVGQAVFAVGTADDGTPLAVAAVSGEAVSEGALETNADVTAVHVYNLRDQALVGVVIVDGPPLGLPSEGGFVGTVAATAIDDGSLALTAIAVAPGADPEVAWERPVDQVVQLGDKLAVDGTLTDAATGTDNLGPTTIWAPTGNPKWAVGWEDDAVAVVNIESGELISRDLAPDAEIMVDPVSDLAVFVAPLPVSPLDEVTQIEVVDLATGETIEEATVPAEKAAELGFTLRGVNDGRLWVTSKQTSPVLDARTGETITDDWHGSEIYTGGAPVRSGLGWAEMDSYGTSDNNYLVAYTGTLDP